MSLIQVTNLTFSYEGSYETIFENVNLQLDSDWKLGFVGRNGRGKTTFLNLLMGKYEYKGSITVKIDFEYFPFTVKDKSLCSYQVLEEIYPDYELWRIRKELSLLEMEEEVLYRTFDSLSGGEQTRLLLALLFSKAERFLLIDEPTNHLDIEARETVSRYLNRKKGFLLVSHDRAFIDKCVDHILAIRRTDLIVQKGNYSSYEQNQLMERMHEESVERKLQGEIRELNKAAARTKGWSDEVEKSKIGQKVAGLRPDRGFIGHKSAKMMKRSKVLENRTSQALEEKKQLLKNVEHEEELKMFPLDYHHNPYMELKEAAVVYNGKETEMKAAFLLNKGDRIALQGRNGCGKSSIMKLIQGEDLEYHGEVRIGSGLIISTVPQSAERLSGSLDEYIREKGMDQTVIKSVLRKLDFERTQFEKEMQGYSEGQKKKILLATSICTPAHVYIWDEPLNYIDIISRGQLRDLILKYQPTMIFTEHDRDFVESIATKVVR